MRHAPFRSIFFFAALLLLGLVAGAVTVPFNFQAGDVIKAEEVNANFAAVANAVDALSSTIPGATSPSAPDDLTLLGGTATEIASITVDVPADGYVDLASSGTLEVDHGENHVTVVNVGLVEDVGDVHSRIEGTASFSLPGVSPSAIYQSPYSVSRLIPATAGTHTYYLAGYHPYGSGTAHVVKPSLRAVYYPSSSAATADLGAADAPSAAGVSASTR